LVQQEGGYHLRWFTPAVEVELCGHATLASAHILWEQGFLPPRAAGVNEDPVTGSAHCCLGPYWAKKLGKEELVAFQASARGEW